VHSEFKRRLLEKILSIEDFMKIQLYSEFGEMKIEKISITKIDRTDDKGNRKFSLSIYVETEDGYFYIRDGDINEL